jgi:hypothetical protein
MTKCLGHLCCQNDFCPLFQHSFMRNEVSWNGDSSQCMISKECLMRSLICIINCKFCDSSPPYLQTCSCKMYYVVHKFPNLSRAVIQLGTHAHPVVDEKCRKSSQDMKNMVVDKVCRMPTTTTISTIVLSTHKTFLSCHLFNGDG